MISQVQWILLWICLGVTEMKIIDDAKNLVTLITALLGVTVIAAICSKKSGTFEYVKDKRDKIDQIANAIEDQIDINNGGEFQ
jgi:hypothetical protein